MKTIKKRIVLRLLKELDAVPLAVAAREMYGRGGELAKIKVVRALCAYRKKDPVFQNVRVRKGKIVRVQEN